MSELILDPTQSAALPTSSPVLVKDSDTDHFTKDVLEPSQKVPVIVYFYTPEILDSDPMGKDLEKLVKRHGGLVHMVRLNVNDNQALAQQLRVQSVPTVFAFKDGRPMDAFAGTQGEAQLQSFIQKLVGDAKPPIQAAMDHAAELLREGLGDEAEQIYTEILSEDSTYIPAFAGIIRAMAVVKDFARAHEMLDRLDDKTRNAVEIQQAVSALELAQQSEQTKPGQISELEATLKNDPNNLQAHFDLAQAYFANQNVSQAIDHLLEIVRLNRDWDDQAGRKQLIKIFDTLGPTDPITVDARKRLSAVLFS